MNISEAITLGTGKLKHFKNPRLETEVLLSFILKKDRVFLKSHSEYKLTPSILNKFNFALKERAIYKPIAYILGYKEWAGLRVKVTPDVLIPRDETETLCRKILAEINHKNLKTLLDIGTGSGCIPLFLQKNRNGVGLKVKALDISVEALDIATENFKLYGVEGDFVQSDLLGKIPINSHFDIITANLPYVPQKMMVSKDISYEPAHAIFSGEDGLNHIRRLADELTAKK